MPLSRNNYDLTIDKPVSEIARILSENTLRRNAKRSISREKTNKLLIGMIQDDGFAVIGSSPIGVFCKAEGKFKSIANEQTSIELATSLQRAFLILLVIWIIVIGLMVLLVPYLTNEDPTFSILPFLQLGLAALIFRLGIHIGYVISKKELIKKIEKLTA